MDKTTEAVRDMYEQYPYPAGTPQIRAAADARLVLSYVERSRSGQGPINVLDAGCGRGLGTLGAAIAQSDVNFHGIDINRVALKQAASFAREQGLTNVRFQECDLMTLHGLDVPDGGYDVIYSLGVIHHMSDPLAGLRKLRDVLAPHGVVALMVYAKHGRIPLMCVREAISLLFPEDQPIAERVELGRALTAFAENGILSDTYWANTSKVNDVEFVDRCLHVNEATFDIASLWELLSRSGMRFVRWIEPDDWSIEKTFPEGKLRERASQLDEITRYKLIERVCSRNSFEVILSRDDNVSRRPLSTLELDKSSFAVNPDVTIICERRNLRGMQRVESLAFKLRHRQAVKVAKGPFATGLLALEGQTEPFRGETWVQAMAKSNLGPAEARGVLMELVNQEILFRPHDSDL